MIGVAVDTVSWSVDRVVRDCILWLLSQVPKTQLEVGYVAKPPRRTCYINSSIKEETPYMLRKNSFQIDLTTPFIIVFSVMCVIVSFILF